MFSEIPGELLVHIFLSLKILDCTDRHYIRPNATSSKSILDTCEDCVTEDGKQRLRTQQYLFLPYNQSLAFPTFTGNLMKQSISNIGAHTYINRMYATDHI